MTTIIAEILSCRVRVLTARQIARHFYAQYKGPMDCARRVIRTLVKQELACAWPVVVAELDVSQPLAVFEPRTPRPEVGHLAWRNEQRWNKASPARTICVTATVKALATYGGSCRRPRPLELEHDINVSGIYLSLLDHEPHVAATWLPEDEIETTEFDGRRPDAIIEHDRPVVLDLLGRGYTREKIAGLVRHYQNHILELW